MKTATVRQLRTAFPSVLNWIENGNHVEISRHGRIVARLLPPALKRAGKVKMPDFAARLRTIHGEKVISTEKAEAILSDNKGRF